MKKEEKIAIVDQLAESFEQYKNLYVTDVSDLTVAQTIELRKLCYKNGIKLKVSKNTHIIKALEKVNVHNEELFSALKGPSSLMFSDTLNGVAKLIKDFRRTHDKPKIKAAYIDDILYLGDSSLDSLVKLKTKNEMIADVVLMLNSPMMNLIGALNSGKNNLTGVLKTLSDKE